MLHTKVFRGNQNKHFVFNDFVSPENRAVYEIVWKNVVQPDRPLMRIGRMRFLCWITKATNTHSEYVILLLFHGNNDSTNVPQFFVCIFAKNV